MAQTKTAFSKVAAPVNTVAAADSRWLSFPYMVAVMVMVTVVSVFHVWSRVKVIDLNLDIAATRRTFQEMQQENKRLKVEIASLKTPARIEALAKGELGMAMPTDQQVIVIK
ncbi:cell division protein FtsL [Geotalea sp. SG265]|uniref:cell division protein FtsL n=1 Tax=Geotalea sp. SG265 TaxID=2922867 RepID=UPI001FAFB87A|nr:cell division protein FtsL [Geotalea sp. SG265]